MEANGCKATSCTRARGCIQWFKSYDKIRKSEDIGAENVWNFDETNVRYACLGGVWAWVPVEIKEVCYLPYIFY